MIKLIPSDIIRDWNPPADIIQSDKYIAKIALNANELICNYVLTHEQWYKKSKFMNVLKRIIVCESPMSAQLAANHIAIENKACNLYEKSAEFGCARTIKNALKLKNLYRIYERLTELKLRRTIFSDAFALVRECIFSPNFKNIPVSVFQNAINSVKQNGFNVVSENQQYTYNHYNWGIHGIHQELLADSFDVLSHQPNFKGKDAKAKMELYNFLKSAFDFIELRDVWIVSKLPVVFHLDEMNRLHHAERPAVEWSDGFSLFYWKGVCVPSQLIMNPFEITSQFINSLQNAEVRRAASEILGNERFAEILNVVTVDEDTDEKGNPVVLLRSNDLDNIIHDYLYYLSVICPSSNRKYYIKVPPSNNVWTSLAWTFDMRRDEYTPIIQT